jgi:hypothetical protein
MMTSTNQSIEPLFLSSFSHHDDETTTRRCDEDDCTSLHSLICTLSSNFISRTMRTFHALQTVFLVESLVFVPSLAFSPATTTTTSRTSQTQSQTQSQQCSGRTRVVFQSRRATDSDSDDTEEQSRSTTITKNKSEKDQQDTPTVLRSEFSTPEQQQQQQQQQQSSGFSYVEFAKTYPFVNNVGIATVKTAAADLLAQTVIAGSPVTEVDLQRSFLFCLFGALYLGAFQYAYQVQIFKRLFDVDKFTSQPLAEKLQDIPGLKALGAQTGLDLTVLTLVYLPTFYIFKASVFSSSGGGSAGFLDPSVWVTTGMDNYLTNFSKDEADLIKVWLPADLVCFSVPLYLRLPVRHIVSFVWTAYLSFSRGGH